MDWISRDEFNLAMLYYNQPDSNGHRYGPNSTEVMDAVEEDNGAVAYLLQRIEQTPSLKGKVNIVISSDHGMAYVNPETTVIDLYTPLQNISKYLMFDSSPATLGIRNQSKKATVDQAFMLINGTEHLNVYYKEDIPDRYHFKKNPRVPPVFAIADNGWLISTQKGGYNDFDISISSSYFDFPSSTTDGMHGYDNAERDMHPFMVAMGPDIQHFEDRQHFYQIDLYPYICVMLGLDKPNKIDGLVDRVLPYLKERPSEEYLEKFRLYATGTLTP
ncbi:Bis 5'-adenosyl triphosphatase enpp4 [Taenia solium]|eukprot:TsM_001213000 transcript=TsM_001213000 gene=TsM_001213000